MSMSIQEIDKLLELKPIERMNEFQLEHFIVENEPTHAAKMWRCLDELRSRRESLVAIDMEIEGLNDNMELTTIQIKRTMRDGYSNDPGEKEEYSIRCRQINRQMVALKYSLQKAQAKKVVIEEEAAYFFKKFNELNALSPYKNPSDPLAQAEYWNEKYANELNMSVLLGRPLNNELIRCILNLNDDSPIKMQVQNMLQQIQKQAIERRKTLESK